MCNQQCERFNQLLYPLAVVLLLVPFLHVGGEYIALGLYTLVVAVLHIHYGVGIVSRFLLLCLFSTRKNLLLLII